MTDENKLHHHVFTSASGAPADSEYATPSGLTACCWNLYDLAFEREVWVETIQKQWPAPDVSENLCRRLDGQF